MTTRQKKWAGLIGGVVLLIVLVIAFWPKSESPEVKSAIKYAEAVDTYKYKDAYDMLCESQQKAISFNRFRNDQGLEWSQLREILGGRELTFTKTAVKKTGDDKALVELKMAGPQGQRYVQIAMVKVGDEWLACGGAIYEKSGAK